MSNEEKVSADRTEIEAIKLAVENLKMDRAGKQIVLKKSIQRLWQFYQDRPEKIYLKSALIHIMAYLELGFIYEDNRMLFDKVLEKLGLDRKTVFANQMHPVKEIPLKKCHVKAVLGRWNPNLHSHKVAEAVNQIIEKVSNEQEGTYLYHCGEKIGAENMWVKTFWLYVTGEGNLLYDRNRNKYYTLICRK